jgi:hypothetical protein
MTVQRLKMRNGPPISQRIRHAIIRARKSLACWIAGDYADDYWDDDDPEANYADPQEWADKIAPMCPCTVTFRRALALDVKTYRVTDDGNGGYDIEPIS